MASSGRGRGRHRRARQRSAIRQSAAGDDTLIAGVHQLIAEPPAVRQPLHDLLAALRGTIIADIVPSP